MIAIQYTRFYRFLLFVLSSYLFSYSPLNALDDKGYDVLVIGAGIAGLSAARELQSKGLTVLVLEARNRVGGRIWTEPLLDAPVDLGAGFLPETKRNPLLSLAHKLKVKTVKIPSKSLALYTSAGKRLNGEEQEKWKELETKVLAQIEIKQKTQKKDDSVKQILAGWIKRFSPFNQQLIRYILHSKVEIPYGTDVADLSFLGWMADKDSKEKNSFLFPQGYSQFIDKLAENIPLLLNHIVVKVDCGATYIVIETDKGLFKAKYAICTVPIGVLKQGSIEFIPALSESKQQAIARLKMGNVHKTCLYFSSVFWDKQADWIGRVSDDNPRWGEFLSLYRSTQNPVLIGINVGQDADDLEKLSEIDIVSQMMEKLRRMYGQSIPDPIISRVTFWGHDPYSLGAFCYQPVGITSIDDLALTQAEQNVFFAGEALFLKYRGTVLGAYLSGIEAAKQILKKDPSYTSRPR